MKSIPIKVALKIDKSIIDRAFKDEHSVVNTVLDCGCVIENSSPKKIAPCQYHSSHKGVTGDPLFKYFKEVLMKEDKE